MIKKVLVTGYNGLVAPYIVTKLKDNFSVYTTSKQSGDYIVDIRNELLVKKMLTKINPEIVIHCAAFTNVDKAEQNVKEVTSINEKGTENLVKNINRDTHFIYISTDQVYSNSNGPHIEGNENPINSYGSSKYKGGLIVKEHRAKYTILHTNIFGRSLNSSKISFVDNIIEKLKKGLNMQLYSDAYFSPLNLFTCSEIVEKIIKKNVYGTYNIGSRNGMSKEMFIRHLANHLNLKINNCSSVEAKTLDRDAKRPLDLRLDVKKIEKKLQVNMPNLIDEIYKL